MSGPAIPLARPPRGYQPSNPEPAQNPPQSVSGIFTLEESRKATYQRVWADFVNWGYTAQEASDSLIRAFASGGVTIAPEPIGDSSDGIAPCGYEEL